MPLVSNLSSTLPWDDLIQHTEFVNGTPERDGSPLVRQPLQERPRCEEYAFID